MATINAPVSTEKVKLALSEKSNDVGTLCTSNKINMWAKCKPVRVAAYDVTQQHIAAISAMTEIEEVKGYDFTAGYPDRPVFDLAADNDNDNNRTGQGDENL